jgi:uncharacterized membrane protein YgdD (TMEM256/DUF423 family)
MQKRLLIFSGFSGAIAVALGAMGAHLLKSKLESGLITETNLQTFETAVRYQIYHSIVLLLLAFFAKQLNSKLINKAAICFMIGIVLFSGSLYLLSCSKIIGISNLNILGPITPIGGLFFIIGWLLLAFTGIKKVNK